MYAITGHTQGIGKAVYNSLNKSGNKVIGFSRSTGYDITNISDINRILEESKECDCIINNAYADFGQSNFLLEAFYKFRNTNKTIINVGSRIAEPNNNLKNHPNVGLLTYQMHKASLKKLCEDLNAYGSRMNIKYVWFGYVGTERILNKYPNLSKDDYILVDEAVDIILGSK